MHLPKLETHVFPYLSRVPTKIPADSLQHFKQFEELSSRFSTRCIIRS